MKRKEIKNGEGSVPQCGPGPEEKASLHRAQHGFVLGAAFNVSGELGPSLGGGTLQLYMCLIQGRG